MYFWNILCLSLQPLAPKVRAKGPQNPPQEKERMAHLYSSQLYQQSTKKDIHTMQYISKLLQVTLSPRQDDTVVVFIDKEHDSLLVIPFKTEFVTTLSKKVKEKTGKELKVVFSDW